jgi:hypothetical protein
MLKTICIGWSIALSTALAGHAQEAVKLTSLSDTIYKTPDVFWLGTDQHVHLNYYNGSCWQMSDPTADAVGGAPPAAAGSALTSLLDTVNHTPDVFYLDTNQHVHILYFNGQWQTTDVTANAVGGAPPAAAGSALTSLLDTVNHTPDVFYLDTNQHVHILYFNGRWQTTDVTANAVGGAPPAAGSTLTSLFDTIYNTPDVFYVGTNQDVHILYFNGQWLTTDVTAPCQGPQITVGITQTQIGPDVCVAGHNFSRGGEAQLSYENIPGRSAPLAIGGVTVSSNGTFNYGDTSQEGGLVSCSNTMIEQLVSILAKDVSTGQTASATVPAAYWCANSTVGTNYNGGCH